MSAVWPLIAHRVGLIQLIPFSWGLERTAQEWATVLSGSGGHHPGDNIYT